MDVALVGICHVRFDLDVALVGICNVRFDLDAILMTMLREKRICIYCNVGSIVKQLHCILVGETWLPSIKSEL